VVKAEGSWPRGYKANPGIVSWTDVSDANYYVINEIENKLSRTDLKKKI
jgi:hypothetical protein